MLLSFPAVATNKVRSVVADVEEAVNTWLTGLFGRDNVDRTVAAFVASQVSNHEAHTGIEAAKKRLGDPRCEMA